MKLSLVQKQSFYHELGQFVKSGIALQQAVEALAPEIGSSALRQLLLRMQKLFLAGETVPETFAQLRPDIGEMEVALIAASSHSGRLEQALSYLSDYFGTLETLRATSIKQLSWPLIELHLGVMILPVVEFYLKGDVAGYFLRCATILAAIYSVGALLWFAGALLLRSARRNVSSDTFLRRLPLIGAVRRNIALNRFCATYEMQLKAAINLMDGLRVAADASQSAVMRAEIERIIPEVRAGSQVAPLLAGSKAFPPALQRVFRIGEQTGTLDDDLHNWTEYYRKASVEKMEALGKWLVRLVTMTIVVYLGYSVVTVFKTYYVDPLNSMLSQ